LAKTSRFNAAHLNISAIKSHAHCRATEATPLHAHYSIPPCTDDLFNPGVLRVRTHLRLQTT